MNSGDCKYAKLGCAYTEHCQKRFLLERFKCGYYCYFMFLENNF